MMITPTDLITTCPECEGAGEQPRSPGRSQILTGACPRCDGARRVLTEQGKVFKAFLDQLRDHRIR